MPKSRAITRANKKKGFPPEEPMSIYNDAGYCDPTPYFAFKNMERESARKQGSRLSIHANITTAKRAG